MLPLREISKTLPQISREYTSHEHDQAVLKSNFYLTVVEKLTERADIDTNDGQVGALWITYTNPQEY